MPNIAAVLKEEIRRLAKKEVKAEVNKTKRALVQYRRDIARLKRLLSDQQKKMAHLESRRGENGHVAIVEDDPNTGLRFSSRSVRSQRRRLGLSAADYGKLIGVSGLTVYNWEQGKTRPRAAQFTALAGIRGIGKREAIARLEEIAAETPKRKPRERMAQALIALGSNAGDRRHTMVEAIKRLGHLPQVRLIAQSSLRETVPAGGPPNQENFLNGAALIETSLPPPSLLAALQQIETDLGRRRVEHWGPRSIDLDLLLYDDLVCQTPDLLLPHPRMAWRRFVLEPAAEIAPKLLHPSTGWPLGRLLEHLNTTPWYVAIAGPIGAGKSRLAAEVVRRTAALGINARAIQERIDLARLATFYASPPRHAWQLELEFLEQRTEELATARPDWAEDRPVVSDFWFDQSLAFARVWLPESQWAEYEARWQAARPKVVRPRLVVYLQASADDLRQRIQVRGRPGEATLTAEQLDRIDDSIRRQTQIAGQSPVMQLASGELDTMAEEVVAAIVAMH